jgi:uncharacterized membrane protein YgcG
MPNKNQLLSFSLYLFTFLQFGYTQDFTINEYHVVIQLNEDGTSDTEEYINVDFSEKARGIIRSIETTRDVGSSIQKYGISNVSTGNKEFKQTNSKGQIDIRIGSPTKYLKDEQSYEIKYKVDNVITPYEEHDEYTWNVIGTEWDADIQKASFEIHLPEELVLDDSAVAVFTGASQSLEQHANVNIGNRKVNGQVLKKLGNGNGLTVAIKFPKQYFSKLDYATILTEKSSSRYSPKATVKKEYPKDVAFPFPLLLLGGLFYFFRKNGRNNHVSILDKRYYPPEGMSPPEIGTFHDYTVHSSDLVSLIPYWGAKKYLKITSMEHEGEVDMRFEKITELPQGTSDYEQEFFDAIFENGSTAYLSNMENSMYEAFGSVKSKLKAEVFSKKLYDTNSKKLFHDGKFIFIGIVALIVAIFVLIKFLAIPSGVLLFLFAILCFYIHSREPKKNEQGLVLHDQLKSLKATLTNPDPEELSQVIKNDPSYLNTIFPYVVAFDLDSLWSEKFDSIFTSSPDWYYSEYDSRPSFGTFRSNFSTNKITKTMTSYPVADKSSSSFGGSGGGFSGGVGSGGGGGGGSSW